MSATIHDVDQPPAVTALRSKDLLGISDLTPDEITLILDTADAMKEIGAAYESGDAAKARET